MFGNHAWFEDVGIDDDDLDDLQRLLWRGYDPVYARAPEIFPRYEQPYERPGWKPPPLPHYEPQPPPVYTEFTCERCGRTFRSPEDDDDAEAEYWAEFGPDAPREHTTLCERCFDLMMLMTGLKEQGQ